MAPEHRKTPLYVKLMAAAISILVFVIASELFLRLIDPELVYKNQFFPLNRDIDFPEFYEKDAQLFWKLRKNQTVESRWFSHLSYQINSLGLRGPEVPKDKPGLRILALGNSCTFGWGVSFEKCWTELLESQLNEGIAGDSIGVVNAGVPGYSSYQGKIHLQKLLYLKPDIVLIIFGWNDHWRAGRDISDAEQNSPPQVVIDLQNELSQLMLYKLIRKATLTLTEDTAFVRLDDISGKRRVSPDEFSENLKTIIKIANENGIKPILVIPPMAALEIYFAGMESNFHMLHQRYQELIIRVGEYQNVPVVNLQIPFASYNDLYDDAHGDPIHFNEKGHEIVAKSIAEAITPLLVNSD